MRNKRIILWIFLVLSSCFSMPKKSATDTFDSLGPIAKVSLGDSEEAAISKVGPPASISTEKYLDSVFETLEYSKPGGLPMGYITIEPDTKKVVAKSFWISDTQPEHEISVVLKRLGPDTKLEGFRACDKHFEGKFKVDRKNGVFVGIQFNEVAFLSWSEPRLTELRIKDFANKCPELQIK